MNEWTHNLHVDDMPNEDMRFIALHCGVDTALKLMEKMPKQHLYIPDPKFLKAKYIIEKHDGSRQSVNNLALECGVSVNFVYGVLKKHQETLANKKQLSLFNYGE